MINPVIKERVHRQYVEGSSQSDLARLFGVHESTISQWRRKDKANGIDWNAERDAHRLTQTGQVPTFESIVNEAFLISERVMGRLKKEEDVPPQDVIKSLSVLATSLEKMGNSYRKISAPRSRLVTAMEVIRMLGDEVRRIESDDKERMVEVFHRLLDSVGRQCVKKYGKDD